jgi:4-aminobutyrate aminotransferase/(S)-3-amino-2-methylpropionate transaminase
MYPPQEMPGLVGKFTDLYRPKGLDFLYSGSTCGSTAVENAMKATFIKYSRYHMNQTYDKDLMLKSALYSFEPGCPSLDILSFKSGFHGRTLKTLELCSSKAEHKLYLALKNKPFAPAPVLRYPLSENVKENDLEIERCLSETRDIIKNNRKPIAGMIIEPIQSEGGDRHMPAKFLKGIRKLAWDNQITFIVDEIQTGGGASGKMWAYEHSLDIGNTPDIVVFGKKLQCTGYFTTWDYIPDVTYKNHSTWHGDIPRLHMAVEIGNIIREEQLLDRVKDTGEFILNGLRDLEKSTDIIHSSRGLGSLMAFDVRVPQPDFVKAMLNHGINASGCGSQSVRLRPSLTLTRDEAAVFLDVLGKVVKTF